MSRRSQSRRRRSFGPRQHEVRQRRPEGKLDWLSDDMASSGADPSTGRPSPAGGEQEAAGA
ncbi:hypothetical protein BH24CHL6_BH24CHL6_13170 [soil metagenome]